MSELTKAQEERAQRLHKEAIVIDTHCDTLMSFLSQRGRPQRSLGERSEHGHIDLPRMIDGGVTCQVFAIYTGNKPIVPDATLRALQMVDVYYEGIEANDEIISVTTPDEIVAAKKAGKTTGLLSIEGAEPLMGDIGLLRVFYRLGVRMLSFAWNYRTPFADGLGAGRSESKLPELGIQALEEMGRLGMIFDVSHLCDSNFWDVADVMKSPFIASHSNCREIADISRNLTDDMIVAIADHGGVMGLNFGAGFVHKEKATVATLVDHVDRVVEVTSIDYVGLGSDFDGVGQLPEGINDVSDLPNITRELVKREYSDEDVLKFLGGNHLRVFKEVIG
ncbi:dipeptidase [Candidatus Bathyarchaeota archaeon]|nr:membrane dipeptidase [Candidatus Bathyarchaeota archaeon]MBL7169043.1 dipeptidase [Candidatus Bathyarchaeota archaeon]